MLKIDVIAVGRLRKGPLFDLAREYTKRITWPLSVHEIDNEKISKHIENSAFVIALDERGSNLRSLDFANKLENLQNTGERHIQFIIGGSDGLSDEIKSRANLLLSFGQQTWPHLLARVMLLEQIYRAQQIMIGHPYHREG